MLSFFFFSHAPVFVEPQPSAIPSHFIEEILSEEEVDDRTAPKGEFPPTAAVVPQMNDVTAKKPAPAAPPTRRKVKRSRADSEEEEEDDFDDDDDDEDDGKDGPLRSSRGKQFVDITEYLCLPQSDAAVKVSDDDGFKWETSHLSSSHLSISTLSKPFFLLQLGIPVSTLSKRWKVSGQRRINCR